MSHTLRTILLGGIIAMPFAVSKALADEVPPEDAKPLSEIIKSVEDEGYERISDVSFDDGAWEVDAYKDDQPRELEINPKSGEILSDKKD